MMYHFGHRVACYTPEFVRRNHFIVRGMTPKKFLDELSVKSHKDLFVYGVRNKRILALLEYSFPSYYPK